MNLYCAPLCEKRGTATVYALLAHAFQTEYHDKLPTIEKTPNGKPYFPERPEIYFSLSHGKTHVLCALSENPVGVDVEAPRQISERAIRFFSTPEELTHFDPLDLWILKESYIKLIGGTLAIMKKIKFSRQPEGNIIVFANSDAAEPEESVKSKLYHISGCRAAVTAAVETPPETIVFI